MNKKKEQRAMDSCRQSCPTKVGYGTKEEAEIHMRIRGSAGTRVYQCRWCKLWFVTSKPERR